MAAEDEVAAAPSEAPAVETEGSKKDEPVALEKLKPVPKPDENELKAKISVEEEAVAELQVKLARIKETLDSRESGRGDSAEVQLAKARLNEAKQETRRVAQEKRNIYDQISAADDLKKQQLDLTNRLKAQLQFNSVEEVDRRIKALEHQQATESLSIKEEKKLLEDIKRLSSNKPLIRQLAEARESFEGVKEHHSTLYAQLKGKTAELSVLKEEEEKWKGQLDTAKAKDDAKRADIPSMIKERDGLRKAMNEHRDTMRKLRDEFNEKRREWFVYSKALRDAKQKEWAERKAAKQAEYEALKKAYEEEEAKRDPWEEEKIICEQLLTYCAKYLPKSEEAKEEAKAAPAAPEGVKLMKRKDDEEDDPYAAVLKKKGKRKGGGGGGAAAAAPKDVKLKHSPEDFRMWDKLSLKPPGTSGECVTLHAALLEKREWLKTAPPKKKKEKKEEKKEEEGSSSEEAAAAAEWKKKEAEELKAKQESERKKAEAAAKAEEERIAKMHELEGKGKKVSGGLHKFDAEEVDVHGGSATAGDFMDAFGFGGGDDGPIDMGDDDDAEADGGDVDYKGVLTLFVDAALGEVLAKQPEDPFRKMYELLFAASLTGEDPPPKASRTMTAEMEAYMSKFSLQAHIDEVISKKGKGSGPKSGCKFMVSDAGDFFSDLSKKMKALGGVAMSAEELRAADAAAAKAKREKAAKEEAARDAADAENAKKTAEMEAQGKKVSGGLHKFDASEVDVNGGTATADDFMDAFGF